jgi:uncharacterized membrane protein
MVTAPPKMESSNLGEPVSIKQITTIFENRCNSCHSANPTDELWVAAPNGVMFDEPQQIVVMKDQIMTRAVLTETMPQGNKTQMTDDERDQIRRWILQGTPLD